MTHPDIWPLLCNQPNTSPDYCPGNADGTALDHDLGSHSDLFTADGRPPVGIGHKSGVHHVLDARTGETVRQRRLSVPRPGDMGLSGIQWGAAHDGRRLYAATNPAGPVTLSALDLASGELLWDSPNPADGGTTGGATAHPDVCFPALVSAVSATPGLAHEGSTDGTVRAYRSDTGKVVWQ